MRRDRISDKALNSLEVSKMTDSSKSVFILNFALFVNFILFGHTKE